MEIKPISSKQQTPKSWCADLELLQICDITEAQMLKAYDVALSFNHKIKVMGRNQTLKYLRWQRKK